MLNKILAQARANPDSLALISSNKNYTYSEVLLQATQRATYLHSLGLEDQCIGIALSDKAEEVLYCLAVLLSRNYFFFVPHQIQDDFLAQVPLALLITDLPVLKSLPCRTLDLFAASDSELDFSPCWSQEIDTTNRRCCVFATSGSTGLAKYVLHDFQSIQEDTFRQLEENQITSLDRIDFLFAASFSSSLASIFPALCSGAGLVIHTLTEQGLSEIPDFWQENRVSFSTLTSSAFRSICRITKSQLREKSKTIRFLCLGGEPISTSDVDLIKAFFQPDTILQLAYASTETRTISSLKFKPSLDQIQLHDGFPVRKKQVFIQSESGHPCQVGEHGEVIVQSPSISLGYFQNLILKYHPTQGDQRIYRTGDRGYVNSEGSIQLLGRSQALVKVNGKLIDLCQLENKIKEYLPPQVHCKVIIDRDGTEIEFLIAFLAGEKCWDETHLRSKLSQVDQIGLMPRRFLSIDEFPLNSNGKIDLSALKLMVKPSSLEELNLQIKDPMMRLIHEIWSKELGITISNVDADFFTSMGGDSLTAEIILQEISEKTGKTLDSSILYQFRSIRKLANFINSEEKRPFPYLEIWSQSPNPEAGWIIFLESGYTDSFLEIKQHLLQEEEELNLACLRLDFFKILENQNVETLIRHWCDMTKGIKPCLWIGVSFNGWIAGKIAEKMGGAVVMFDSISYTEKSKSSIGELCYSRLKYMIWTLKHDFSWASFGKSITILTQYFLKKSNFKKQKPSLFVQAVSEYIRLGSPINSLSHLLYFYSKRSIITSPQDIKNWKSLNKGVFELVEIDGGHLDGCAPEFGKTVASEILKFQTKILLKT